MLNSKDRKKLEKEFKDSYLEIDDFDLVAEKIFLLVRDKLTRWFWWSVITLLVPYIGAMFTMSIPVVSKLGKFKESEVIKDEIVEEINKDSSEINNAIEEIIEEETNAVD